MPLHIVSTRLENRLRSIVKVEQEGRTFVTEGISRATPEQKSKAIRIVEYYEGLPLAIYAIGHRLNATGKPVEKYRVKSWVTDKKLAEPFLGIMNDLFRLQHWQALHRINVMSLLGHQTESRGLHPSKSPKATRIVEYYEGLPLAIYAIGHRLNATGKPVEKYRVKSWVTDKKLAEPFLGIMNDLFRLQHWQALHRINVMSFLGHQSKATRIVEYYEGLPLAIHAIGHHLNATGKPVEKYRVKSWVTDKKLAEPFLGIMNDLFRLKHRQALHLINVLSFLGHQFITPAAGEEEWLDWLDAAEDD
ncbi:hypothetical protein N7461_002174 [Penicillium sp. DV-2018c]|nr:hypothetical protein N7461_002174 [Penicillium sp. DV-2018c]